MGTPTASDPLGQRPDPDSIADMMEQVIDRRIEKRLSGRSSTQFDGIADHILVFELIARGWAVFKPSALPQPIDVSTATPPRL